MTQAWRSANGGDKSRKRKAFETEIEGSDPVILVAGAGATLAEMESSR